MASESNRSELVAIVRTLLTSEGTEDEQDHLLTVLEARLPHPNVSDLIYNCDVELTAEEIVDVALGYRPIVPGEAPKSPHR